MMTKERRILLCHQKASLILNSLSIIYNLKTSKHPFVKCFIKKGLCAIFFNKIPLCSIFCCLMQSHSNTNNHFLQFDILRLSFIKYNEPLSIKSHEQHITMKTYKWLHDRRWSFLKRKKKRTQATIKPSVHLSKVLSFPFKIRCDSKDELNKKKKVRICFFPFIVQINITVTPYSKSDFVINGCNDLIRGFSLEGLC